MLGTRDIYKTLNMYILNEWTSEWINGLVLLSCPWEDLAINIYFHAIGYWKKKNWIYIFFTHALLWIMAKTQHLLRQTSNISELENFQICRCWKVLRLWINWNSPASSIVRIKCYSEREHWYPHGNRAPLKTQSCPCLRTPGNFRYIWKCH